MDQQLVMVSLLLLQAVADQIKKAAGVQLVDVALRFGRRELLVQQRGQDRLDVAGRDIFLPLCLYRHDLLFSLVKGQPLGIRRVRRLRCCCFQNSPAILHTGHSQLPTLRDF